MKQFTFIAIFLVAGMSQVQAQVTATQALPDTSKMTCNQISQSGNLVVFPAKSQRHQQQKEDEFYCYLWAVELTGIDPLNLQPVIFNKV